jgi:monoamine oxidase
MTDIIIIGAGAAGLNAARALSAKKYSITILEARDRVGGRIHTINDQGFSAPVESGAEFIHGEMPHTMTLMKEAKVSYQSGKGRTWNIEEGKLNEGDLFHDDWDVLLNKLKNLKEDITLANFLDQHFTAQKYQSLKEEVTRFVQGYDAADIHKVSAKALYEEWSGENIKGYRPIGGYGTLMTFLLEGSIKNGATLKLSSPVKTIRWKNGNAEIVTKKEKFTAKKVIITVPVNVLKSGSIQFEPAIPNHLMALQQLEVGGVIKFLVEFKDAIWERNQDATFRKMNDLNFLFSDAFVPTWWTQNPSSIPLLTGWLAGPVINTIKHDDHSLLNYAFESLAYFFNCSTNDIQREVHEAKVFNWTTDPFAQGAYAYKTLKTSEAVKKILTPIEDTLYFAGEALYDGAEMGTVEAALASGASVAEKVVIGD